MPQGFDDKMQELIIDYPVALSPEDTGSPRVQGMVCPAEHLLTEDTAAEADMSRHVPEHTGGTSGAPRNLWGRLCPSFEFPQSPHEHLYPPVTVA